MKPHTHLRPRSRSARLAAAVALAATGAGLLVPRFYAHAALVDASIVGTVHPTLAPSSAIHMPLKFNGDQTSVWKNGSEQRMFLSGHVSVDVGLRQLHADSAAVWLTPGREAGENTYDVAIYLSGNVTLSEGTQATSTRTVGKELLVTTRVAQDVVLTGTPVSKVEEQNPLVKRGNDLRMELLTRPAPAMHIAKIVITPAEQALQSGWIAKGPNNEIISGPGDIKIVKGPNGEEIQAPPAAAKPRPDAFVVGDAHTAQLDNETVTVVTHAYFFYDAHDGSPPIEFRAQRMVLFSPKELGAAASQPAGAASAPAVPKGDLSRQVTGAYMEGDVSIDHGEQLSVHAEQIYYDLTSHRAIMLDAIISTVDEVRNIPIYLRAAEIRQLARGEFAAKKATFSTSEFFTPHYHIGASDVYLQDVTPDLSGVGGGGGGPPAGIDVGLGSINGSGGAGGLGQRTYKFEAHDATINVQGMPIFWWPLLSGDTNKNTIPLNTIRVSNSKTYGLSILTDWDIFGLAGQHAPEGLNADLSLDYYGKRGPAAGVQATWKTDDDHGLLRSYALIDQGADRLGRDLENILPDHETRDRITVRDQRELGDGLTLQLEASYISDPNFLQQFFQQEFDADKEHETSLYLKKQGETDALSILGKFNLFDFTATADQVDSQFSTEKKPEVKYWRLGDSFLDMFTYYSETSGSNLKTNITDLTPSDLGLTSSFLAAPAAAVPANMTFRQYYQSLGWTDGDVLRGDTRQELDMPLTLGDAKIVPYIAGRATVWDDAFPTSDNGSSTTRLWGSAGLRSSMQFSHVYNDVDSVFWDVHRLRHIIEPQLNIFASADSQDRKNLQPFDPSVEGISGASGMSLSIDQKWQTQRGGEDHYRNVDWIVLDVTYNQFWNKDKTGLFYPTAPLRGFFFDSRPELSQVADSIDVDGVWRIGERFRFLGEGNYNLDTHKLETFSAGFAVDQSPSLSYFFGNRYIRALNTDEWTIAADYQLAQKYQLIAAESYDSQVHSNILSSITLIRQMPRFYTALTITYNANDADTSVVVTAWPEGFASSGIGNRTGTAASPRQ